MNRKSTSSFHASLITVEAADLNAVLCGPVCMIWCPFGNVMDEKGCPTCRCKSGEFEIDISLTCVSRYHVPFSHLAVKLMSLK